MSSSSPHPGDPLESHDFLNPMYVKDPSGNAWSELLTLGASQMTKYNLFFNWFKKKIHITHAYGAMSLNNP